jgi:hypothetical protein
VAVLAVKQLIVNLFDKNKFKQIIFNMKSDWREKGDYFLSKWRICLQGKCVF